GSRGAHQQALAQVQRDGLPQPEGPAARARESHTREGELRRVDQCFKSARISEAARSPVSTPPLRYPWKSTDVCSPAKWQVPERSPSAPENFVYWPTFQ